MREEQHIYSKAVEENPILASRLRSPSPLMVHRRPSAAEKAQDVNKTLPKKNSRQMLSKNNLEKLPKSNVGPADAKGAGHGGLEAISEVPKNIFAKKLVQQKKEVQKQSAMENNSAG